MSYVPKSINWQEIIKTIDEPWQPKEVLCFNDQIVRIAKFEGEYHWHTHEQEDEVFFVISGEIVIQIKEGTDIVLKQGEMGMVPKGIEHCPKSEDPSIVLMIEPDSLNSSGDS